MSALQGVLYCSLLALFAPSASAQLGDRADDPQRPPNVDLAIPPAPVLSPAEELQSFVLPAGFRMELVASEPLVHDPVAVAFDPRGRLWVVEFSTFNAEVVTALSLDLKDVEPQPAPVGRVVFLERHRRRRSNGHAHGICGQPERATHCRVRRRSDSHRRPTESVDHARSRRKRRHGREEASGG